LLDTVVISEIAKDQPVPNVIAWIDSLDSANSYLSVVTLGEVLYGIERMPFGRRRLSREGWYQQTREIYFERILPLDLQVTEEWGASLREWPQLATI
jgi:predicted nucleic acid-binding protein